MKKNYSKIKIILETERKEPGKFYSKPSFPDIKVNFTVLHKGEFKFSAFTTLARTLNKNQTLTSLTKQGNNYNLTLS